MIQKSKHTEYSLKNLPPVPTSSHSAPVLLTATITSFLCIFVSFQKYSGM